jgi:flagellar basal-body rod protein FlgC
VKLDRVFSGLNISAMGLSAQRRRMNSIAGNLANAETTTTEAGGPYRRKIVQITAKSTQMFGAMMRSLGAPLAATHPGHITEMQDTSPVPQGTLVNMESREVDDTSAPRMVYDPTHPEANAEGYVAMPNINVVTEMVNMISAARSFEANVVAVNAAKNMAKDSLEI